MKGPLILTVCCSNQKCRFDTDLQNLLLFKDQRGFCRNAPRRSIIFFIWIYIWCRGSEFTLCMKLFRTCSPLRITVVLSLSKRSLTIQVFCAAPFTFSITTSGCTISGETRHRREKKKQKKVIFLSVNDLLAATIKKNKKKRLKMDPPEESFFLLWFLLILLIQTGSPGFMCKPR